MALTIGELVAYISADDTAFRRGMASAREAMASTSKTIVADSLKASAAVAAIGAAASVGALGIAGALALGVGGFGVFLAMNDKLKAAFADVGKVALEAFQKAAAPLQGPLHAGLAQLTTRIGPLAKALGKAFTSAAPLIKTVFDTIITVVDSLVANLPKIVAAGVPVAQFLVTVLGGALSGLLSGVRWVIEKIEAFKQAMASGSGPVSEWGAKISEIVGKVKEVFATIFGAISKWVTENRATIQGWADALSSGFNLLLGAVSSALDAIKALWDVFGGTILTVIGGIVSAVTGVFSGLMQALKGIFEVFAGIFTGDWSRAWEGVKTIFSGVWNAIKALFSGLLTALAAIASKGWELIKKVAAAAWEGLKTLASKAWDGLKNIVATGVTNVVTFMKELPGKILAALGDLASLLLNAGKDVIRGLWNGLSSMAAWIKGKIMALVKAILPDAVEDILGISSPSKVFATIGEQVMAGMSEGLKRGGTDVLRTAQDIARKTAQIVKGEVLSGPYGVPAAEGEIARLLGSAKFGLGVNALTPEPAPAPKPNPKRRTDPNDVTYDRNPPPASGYVQPSSAGVNVTVNMPNATVREDADVTRLGNEFGFKYLATPA
jgi:phage-related protein